MRSLHTTKALIIVLVIGLTGAFVAQAQGEKEMQPQSDQSGHVMVMPDNLNWTDGPPSLPSGAKFAVLEGDPKQAGPFTMRLQFPADYKIPAHSHPAIEHVTVLSGTLNLGMGDKLDPTKGEELSAGGFALMPANTNHFAWTKEETTIQLHGIGPWGINYVNPADDPRQQSKEQ